MGQTVVVLEKDPGVAQSLAGGLCAHFSVHVTDSREELQERLANSNHPEAVVFNIEHWRLTDEPAMLVGMDALGVLDTLLIDYRRHELQIRMRSQ